MHGNGIICLAGIMLRYYVDYKDFYSGNLIVNGKFNAVEKMYYKKVRRGFGYELVVEKLENGVDI